MRGHIAAALAFAALALSAPAAHAASVPAPAVTKSGGVTIVTQYDPAATLAGVAFFVPAGLDRQQLSQNGLAALTAESILRTAVGAPGKTIALEEAAAAQGGSVTFSMQGRAVRFYIEGTPSTIPALLTLFEQAISKPDFSLPTLNDARERLGRMIAANQQVALRVGMEMLDSQFFADANIGMPDYGTPTSLAQYVTSDVQGFYARSYRRTDAVISAAGALTALPESAYDTLAQTLPAGRSTPVSTKLPDLHGTSRQLIAHRDVSAPWLVAQYPAPPMGSRDFGAMLVLSAFIDRTLADVADVPNLVSRSFADRAVGTIYTFYQKPASMIVYIDGGLGDPSRTFATALTVIHVIGTSTVKGSIDQFKAQAAGNFIADATTLSDRAWIAGEFAQSGASTDYMNATLASISEVTPADLQRVARAYLGNPTVALVLPRQGF